MLLLFALVAFYALFGILGVMLAAPLTIAGLALVRSLYLHEHPQPPSLAPTGDDDAPRPNPSP